MSNYTPGEYNGEHDPDPGEQEDYWYQMRADRFEVEVMSEQWERDIEPHKRPGYAEMMEEAADRLRDEMKERGL